MRISTQNMKNVYISNELIKRIQKSPDKEKVCIQIAQETIKSLKENKIRTHSIVRPEKVTWSNSVTQE